MSYIKHEFIKRILQDEGSRLKKYQGLAIEKRIHFHTGNLFNKRFISINAEGSDGAVLSFKHTARERFLDIKRSKRGRETNRIVTTNRKIHNTFVFGHYQRIATRLMYDFTDDVADQIIKDFNSK